MACEQRAQMMMRARMWGVCIGDVEIEHANMLESPRVIELMAPADVVLVNTRFSARRVSSPPSVFRLCLGTNSGIVQ